MKNPVIAINKFKGTFRFFSDNTLSKKASLNAVAVGLDYGARLIVVFLTTPLILAGLGQYLYGTWQVLNRLLGYITASSGRPTQALKWTIARDQVSSDYTRKQEYVGSAIIVWVAFLPLMLLLGGILVWKVPFWLKTPAEYYLPIRLCIGFLVANLAMTTVAEIPMSVLQGENLGYKRMGLTTATVLMGGVFIWLAIRLDTGIVGIAAAALVTTLLTGAVFLKVARKFTPWFKVSFPSFRQTRDFFRLSFWFLSWNLIMNLMTASDVVVFGFLASVEGVADYSLSKYAPEVLISVIALVVFGITPGLGGIIGSGKLKKAAQIRGEMLTMTWLVTTGLGATILFWNRTFLDLWVGPGHYVGTTAAFLIAVVVTQFVIIRSDVGIIDLSLNLRRKVLLGFCSSAAAILIMGVLVGYFKLGVVGLCLGLIIGRLMLSVGYPAIVGRLLGLGVWSQLRSCLRPALITILLYSCAAWLESYINLGAKSGLRGWIIFLASAGISASLFLAASFFLGLSRAQQKTVLLRLRAVNLLGSS